MSDEVLVPKTNDELEAYTKRFFARYFGEVEEPEPPVLAELIYDLMYEGRDVEAWPVVLALVNGAPTREALAFVAAAALEDLTGFTPTTDEVYRQIADEARHNEKLRDAFRMIYWTVEPEWFRSEIGAMNGETN